MASVSPVRPSEEDSDAAAPTAASRDRNAAVVAAKAVPQEYVWMIALTFCFALANGISHGRWQPIACGVLIVAMGILCWRFFPARTSSPVQTMTAEARQGLILKGMLALLVSLPILGLADPTILAQPVRPMTMIRVVQGLSILLIASYFPYLGTREPERLRSARFIGFAILLVVGGISVIHITPFPGIDVWTIQQRGADALLAGKNPYVWANVPDTDPENDFTVPYVYPPAAIYFGTIGRVLTGDVRYMLVGAMLVAGITIRFITKRVLSSASTTSTGSTAASVLPSIMEDAPAIFFWQAPLLYMCVELSWVDPLQVMLIALGVAAYLKDKKTLAAVILGVTVSSKQSMFWLYPLAAVILRFDRKQWVVMGIAALVPVLPFLIWDFNALKHANFDFMSGLPPRRDALCFTNAMWQWFHIAFPTVSAFLLAAVTVAFACLKKRKEGQDENKGSFELARALVITYFVFFFFNRWAFANYYFLLTGLSALASALALGASRPQKPMLAEQ